jgi:hypothetical protein
LEDYSTGRRRLENIYNKVQKTNTYFSRGMCSKGPDVGIVPHKLLLETSLEKETESFNDQITYQRNIKEKQSPPTTYKTFKVEILVSSLGI